MPFKIRGIQKAFSKGVSGVSKSFLGAVSVQDLKIICPDASELELETMLNEGWSTLCGLFPLGFGPFCYLFVNPFWHHL